jgi:hypothetical protein
MSLSTDFLSNMGLVIAFNYTIDSTIFNIVQSNIASFTTALSSMSGALSAALGALAAVIGLVEDFFSSVQEPAPDQIVYEDDTEFQKLNSMLSKDQWTSVVAQKLGNIELVEVTDHESTTSEHSTTLVPLSLKPSVGVNGPPPIEFGHVVRAPRLVPTLLPDSTKSHNTHAENVVSTVNTTPSIADVSTSAEIATTASSVPNFSPFFLPSQARAANTASTMLVSTPGARSVLHGASRRGIGSQEPKLLRKH